MIIFCSVIFVIIRPSGRANIINTRELIQWIRKKIGPIATPDKLQFSPGLPKTRSGKIMRRILRKIASKEEDQLGDTSTLADPNVVQSLIDGSKNI